MKNTKIDNMNIPMYNALSESIAEANRFIKKAKAAQQRILRDKHAWAGNKDSSAAKRASMDLSRALTEFRKPKT